VASSFRQGGQVSKEAGGSVHPLARTVWTATRYPAAQPGAKTVLRGSAGHIERQEDIEFYTLDGDKNELPDFIWSYDASLGGLLEGAETVRNAFPGRLVAEGAAKVHRGAEVGQWIDTRVMDESMKGRQDL
jgi:hypothetical protein